MVVCWLSDHRDQTVQWILGYCVLYQNSFSVFRTSLKHKNLVYVLYTFFSCHTFLDFLFCLPWWLSTKQMAGIYWWTPMSASHQTARLTKKNRYINKNKNQGWRKWVVEGAKRKKCTLGMETMNELSTLSEYRIWCPHHKK